MSYGHSPDYWTVYLCVLIVPLFMISHHTGCSLTIMSESDVKIIFNSVIDVWQTALASCTVLLHTDMLHMFKDLQCQGRNQIINMQLNKAS